MFWTVFKFELSYWFRRPLTLLFFALFGFLFHFVPGFAQIRAPGRMTAVLAPTLLVGVLALSAAARRLADPARDRQPEKLR